MKINRGNYETILLDYLEGRLSEDERRDADAFLAENPDIAADFSLLSNSRGENGETIFLPSPEETVFPDKDRLYRIARRSATRPVYSFSVKQVRIDKIRRLLPYATAIAACILLFLIFLPRPERIAEPDTDLLVTLPGPDVTLSFANDSLSSEPQLISPGVPPTPTGKKTVEPYHPDSLPKLTPGNLRRLITPMARLKTYYAQTADLKLLPRTAEHEWPVEQPKTHRRSKAKIFFTSLFRTYTEPFREQIEDDVENLRYTSKWKEYATDTVYQAFWEEDSDF